MLEQMLQIGLRGFSRSKHVAQQAFEKFSIPEACVMSEIQAVSVSRIEETTKIEISFERVAVWTLIFTNVFFISYFFGKLFRLI